MAKWTFSIHTDRVLEVYFDNLANFLSGSFFSDSISITISKTFIRINFLSFFNSFTCYDEIIYLIKMFGVYNIYIEKGINRRCKRYFYTVHKIEQ